MATGGGCFVCVAGLLLALGDQGCLHISIAFYEYCLLRVAVYHVTWICELSACVQGRVYSILRLFKGRDWYMVTADPAN